jgi:hypothetical protein
MLSFDRLSGIYHFWREDHLRKRGGSSLKEVSQENFREKKFSEERN